MSAGTKGSGWPAKLRVQLLDESGELMDEVGLNEDGGFRFADLPLEVGENRFELRLLDADGHSLLDHEVRVVHDPAATAQLVMRVMPRSLYVEDRHHLVVGEGERLPLQREIKRSRAGAEADMELPLLMDHIEVGSIAVRGIPREAGPGAPVRFCFRVDERGRIDASAAVLDAKGQPVARCETTVMLPPTVLPRLEDLKKDAIDLLARLEDAMAHEADPARRARLVAMQEKEGRRLQSVLEETRPDPGEAHMLAAQLRDVLDVARKTKDWSPSRQDFDALMRRTESLLDELDKRRVVSDAERDSYRKALDKFKTNAQKAYSGGDYDTWREQYIRLEDLWRGLYNILTPGEGARSAPEPSVTAYVAYAMQEYANTSDRLNKRYEELMGDVALSVDRREMVEERAREVKTRLEKVKERLDALGELWEGAARTVDEENKARQEVRWILSELDKLNTDIQHLETHLRR